MTTLYPRVTAVTIMYGDRWKFLSQVVIAVMRDPYITKLVIVDNGSKNKKEIEKGVKEYGDRVTVLCQEKNLGSAGGFAVGLDYARSTDCDFVFILDDDSIPEEGSIMSFMEVLRFFPDRKVVLSGSRDNVLGNKEYFYKPSIPDDSPRGTFFEVFSIKKFINFIKLLDPRKKKIKRGPFIPIIPTEGFVYGGAFIPIEAVREAALPDASLFLYGDDVEYSWNIKKLGYESYLCSRPRLYDVDLTFGESGSHLLGQFDSSTLPFKVYYRMRNMVRLSVKHSKQLPPVLFLNVFFWTLGLLILGLFRLGHTKLYWQRAWLIIKAVIAGYFPNLKIARETEASFPQVSK